LRNDRRGIEGLPLRLMLVALLISLTLPTMLSFMNSTASSMAGDKAAGIAESMAMTLEEMGAGGPGNVREVYIPNDLPGGVVLRIGGGNGTIDCARITWNTGGEVGTRYLRGVSVLTEDGSPLSLSAGDAIRLECTTGSWGTVKVVRI